MPLAGYPSNTLYPANDLYPGVPNPHHEEGEIISFEVAGIVIKMGNLQWSI